MVPQIIITSMPRYSYFQWFLLGLYQLEKEGKIKLKFKVGLYERLTLLVDNRYICGGVMRLLMKYRINNKYIWKDSYCLTGEYRKGKQKKYFCIDCADAPFLFNQEMLAKCSVYFKIQCPLSLEDDGFWLNNQIKIPWTDHEHYNPNMIVTDMGPRKACSNFNENKHKIKPLMIGVRQLSRGCSYKALLKGYNNLLLSRGTPKKKKLMCYFGNAKGPSLQTSSKPTEIDYDSEAQLMDYYRGLTEHPNTKRKIATDIIKSLGDNYDGRIINEGNSDTGKPKTHPELIVPLKEFSNFVAQFDYNLNICGYKMSIPNRFIDSFISGTAIVTDKLRVKWYRPFGKSVFETVEMGYLNNYEVDWEGFKKDISNLPPVIAQETISEYEEKWKPLKVANYILEELSKS